MWKIVFRGISGSGVFSEEVVVIVLVEDDGGWIRVVEVGLLISIFLVLGMF